MNVHHFDHGGNKGEKRIPPSKKFKKKWIVLSHKIWVIQKNRNVMFKAVQTDGDLSIFFFLNNTLPSFLNYDAGVCTGLWAFLT